VRKLAGEVPVLLLELVHPLLHLLVANGIAKVEAYDVVQDLVDFVLEVLLLAYVLVVIVAVHAL